MQTDQCRKCSKRVFPQQQLAMHRKMYFISVPVLHWGHAMVVEGINCIFIIDLQFSWKSCKEIANYHLLVLA